MARDGTTAQLERLVRAYRRADPAAENAAARAQQEARWLHTRWTEDGMLVVEGRLTPEQGALLRRALEVVLREQEQKPERAAGAEALPSMAQRQADALAQVADRALGQARDPHGRRPGAGGGARRRRGAGRPGRGRPVGAGGRPARFS